MAATGWGSRSYCKKRPLGIGDMQKKRGRSRASSACVRRREGGQEKMTARKGLRGASDENDGHTGGERAGVWTVWTVWRGIGGECEVDAN